MVKPRTGSVRKRGEVFYLGIRLRSGKWWERPIPRPKDGGPYDEAYADLVRAQRVLQYTRGEWDPERVEATPATDPTVAEYALEWVKGQTYESAPKDRQRIERYLAPSAFGQLRVREARPKDAAAWIKYLVARKTKRTGTLGGSAIRNAFDVVQRAFDAAIVDELATNNILRLVRKNLPAKADKNPAAREGWTFTRGEIEQLISDPRVKPERRVRYAILFLSGMRFGEFAALRWRDWDREAEPLTRLTVQRAIKSVSKREGTTKTGAKKLVPVHPTLAAILAEWRLSGWPAAFGRHPEPDDYVLPTVRGKGKGRPSNGSAANRSFKADQTALGMTARHQHVARHAFITLAQDDGADADVLKWATHAPPKSGQDNYKRGPWRRLCEEVARLRIERRDGVVVEMRRKAEA